MSNLIRHQGMQVQTGSTKVRMWRNWNIHTLLVGMETGTFTLEHCLTVYHKTECMHNLESNNTTPRDIETTKKCTYVAPNPHSRMFRAAQFVIVPNLK